MLLRMMVFWLTLRLWPNCKMGELGLANTQFWAAINREELILSRQSMRALLTVTSPSFERRPDVIQGPMRILQEADDVGVPAARSQHLQDDCSSNHFPFVFAHTPSLFCQLLLRGLAISTLAKSQWYPHAPEIVLCKVSWCGFIRRTL